MKLSEHPMVIFRKIALTQLIKKFVKCSEMPPLHLKNFLFKRWSKSIQLFIEYLKFHIVLFVKKQIPHLKCDIWLCAINFTCFSLIFLDECNISVNKAWKIDHWYSIIIITFLKLKQQDEKCSFLKIFRQIWFECFIIYNLWTYIFKCINILY